MGTRAVDTMVVDARAVYTRAAVSQKVDTKAAVSYHINKVKPVLTLCWGACHPHATLTLISSVYIDHSAI